MAGSRIAYRPELDGLRGIAVLLVIAYHARIPGFGGGSFGVTLFFVLSGFLITSLLLAEHRATDRVNLRAFYERRIRRLAPALIAVIAVTGIVMLAQGRFGEYPGQAIAALLYSSNIAVATGAELGYLDHTWSLALEEQFYIVWPLLLIAGRRWLVPIAVAGIAWAVVMRFAAPDVNATFRPDLRMDAVLWGCLLALVPLRLPSWAIAAGWAALACLVVLATPAAFPLTFAAAPIASLLVIAGASLVPALRWRWLVRVGQISYGLYLWHMVPVLMLRFEGPAGIALAIAVTFALALASERWIERPWRRSRLRDADVAGHDSARPTGPRADRSRARVDRRADGVGV